jgi:hypothetical protein
MNRRLYGAFNCQLSTVNFQLSRMSCEHKRAIDTLDGLWCPDCKQNLPPATRLSGVSAQSIHPAPLLAEPSITSESFPPALPLSQGLACEVAMGRTAGGKGKPWRSVRYTRSHGHLYYRFAWGIGHKIEGDVHIKGGSIDSPVAAARAEQVQRWINQGVEPTTIAEMISRW